MEGGQTLAQLGQPEKAIEAYTQAIEISPKYATALNARGTLYLNARRNTEALADFNAAIELNPNWGAPRYNIGLIYAGLGQTEKAMQAYDDALRVSQIGRAHV